MRYLGISDPRVHAGLEKCLRCHTSLTITAVAHGIFMALFGHCPGCSCLYVLDEMIYPEDI